MKNINNIINEIGISKVKLAKYLGVSRQMVYNYLEMDDINDLPLEKKMKLFNLFKISSTDELDKIKIDNEFIKHANNLINSEIQDGRGELLNFSELDNKDQKLLNDLIFLLKDKLIDDETNETTNILRYLYYYMQAIDNKPELKYLLGYIAKSSGFVDMNEYVFNKEKQFDFEAIQYSAIVLFNNGNSSKQRLKDFHAKFEKNTEKKHEEMLSRTQELTQAQVQALKELGYKEFNAENASEIFQKIAEIELRRI